MGAGTVADLLRGRENDDSTGLVVDEIRWTWRDVIERSLTTAQHLIELRGDGPFHVGILMDNTPDYLFTLFGAALAGAVSVGVNNTRRGEQLALDIRHSDCQIVVTDRASAPLLDGLDLGPARVERVDSLKWSDAVGRAAGFRGELPQVPADDLFTLIFTSGSTGAPKAVRMSHGRAFDLASRWSAVSPDDVVYCSIPLFHTNALTSMALPAVTSGCAPAASSVRLCACQRGSPPRSQQRSAFLHRRTPRRDSGEA
jgi:fatty-acyl-CoA synthase